MTRLMFIALGALTCLACTMTSVAEETPRIAVLVAVDKYPDGGPSFYDIPTEAQIQQLARLLRQGGYEVRILSITAAQEDPRLAPTAEGIKKAVVKACEDITKRIKGSNTTPMLFVALSGHGVTLGAKPIFCPTDIEGVYDADKNLSSVRNGLDYETIASLMDNELKKISKVLLVDACRDPVKAPVKLPSGYLEEKETIVIKACSDGQKAKVKGFLEAFIKEVRKKFAEGSKDRQTPVGLQAVLVNARDIVQQFGQKPEFREKIDSTLCFAPVRGWRKTIDPAVRQDYRLSDADAVLENGRKVFYGLSFKGDFPGVYFKGCTFVGCRFSKCDFRNARVANARFEDCDFIKCSFIDASGTNTMTIGSGCRLEETQFPQSDRPTFEDDK